ncbi:MAG: hypothetical protein WC455_17245 [Dehalococcoidia bacterium]
MRRYISRYKWCPDKTCRPLAKQDTVENPERAGFCIGQLKHPTDHRCDDFVVQAVNDMALCFKQTHTKPDRFHLNIFDIIHGIRAISTALKARSQSLPAWVIKELADQ